MSTEAKQFKGVLIGIATEQGMTEVPALVHDDIPNLAVTCDLACTFSVTQIASGMTVSGTYERAGNAALAMVRLHEIAQDAGFQWDMTPDQLKPFFECHLKDHRRVIEAIQMERDMFATHEFPWEESHPLADACERIADKGEAA